MTSNQIIELMNREPFTPLEIRLSDGSSAHVNEPFEIATQRNSPFCIVYNDEGTARFIAIRNITEIVTHPVEPTFD